MPPKHTVQGDMGPEAYEVGQAEPHVGHGVVSYGEGRRRRTTPACTRART